MIWNARPTKYFKYYFRVQGKCNGLRLTFQNVFMFLFLGDGAQKVPCPVRGAFNWKLVDAHSAPNLVWDLIKGNRCDGPVGEWKY